MPSLDIGKLVADVETTVSGVLKKDVTTTTGFAQQQLQAIARQAELIASSYLAQPNDAQRDADLDDLKDMVKTFIEVIQGLAVIEVEKAWIAAVGVIWGAIGKAINVALPVP